MTYAIRSATNGLTSAVAAVLYYSGALEFFHRLRNRDTLTVVVFHRVLSVDDPRSATALTEWTIGSEAFDACLAFFRRHYNLVSLDAVMAALAGTSRLPERSLLITFDDGFADNRDYALPLLRKHGAEAVVFVSTDIIGQTDRLWAEDMLWAAQAGYLGDADVRAVYRLTRGQAPSVDSEPAVLLREIVWRHPSGPPAGVEAVLGDRADLHRVREPRQMLDAEGISELARHGVAIGAHGKTHTALIHVDDLADELETPRKRLGELLGPSARPGIDALAFPHGVYTAEIVKRALAADYRLLFTVDDELVTLDGGRLCTPVIGRINVDGRRFAANGRLRRDRLALTLFTRRHSPSVPGAPCN